MFYIHCDGEDCKEYRAFDDDNLPTRWVAYGPNYSRPHSNVRSLRDYVRLQHLCPKCAAKYERRQGEHKSEHTTDVAAFEILQGVASTLADLRSLINEEIQRRKKLDILPR